MPSKRFVFNGVNATTGTYGVPPMTAAELAAIISGTAKPDNLSELKLKRVGASQRRMGLKAGVDPKDLAEAGWGIIFARDADPKIIEALGPLIEHRRAQAGARFRIYSGPQTVGGGVRKDESKRDFLARNGVGQGPANPDKVPYYLLIVGGPDEIPYSFQYLLDLQYAVGRIHFDAAVMLDPIQAYANYAKSVVAAEKAPSRDKSMVFFAPANPDDDATGFSSSLLATPLADELMAEFGDWTVTKTIGTAASKEGLKPLLGGAQTPSVLFTASHGMEFDLGDERQVAQQGALLCQDWAGPNDPAPIEKAMYYSGDDLAADANLQGLIAFLFACYGGGTPQMDEFHKFFFKDREQIAARPFVAGLPQRMLGQEAGGALAVVGHVERAWTFSFMLDDGASNRETFRSMLAQLLQGHPVGSALDFFNLRYAEFAAELSTMQDEIEGGASPDEVELALLWTSHNDARGYALFGDPAVRLNV